MQTAPEDADRAIASTISLLQQIRKEGVTDAEIANAKRSLTSAYPVELASPNNLASTILSNAVYGLPLSAIRTYTDTINAITPAQVNALIQEVLQPDRLVIVTAGPNASTSQK